METTNRAFIPDPKRHYISAKKAKELVKHYQNSLPGLLKKGIKPDTFPMSELFAKEAVIALLKQRNCAGLRIYGGMTKKGKVVYVLIGVDKNARNINKRAMILPRPRVFNKASNPGVLFSATEQQAPVILEEGIRCPPFRDDDETP